MNSNKKIAEEYSTAVNCVMWPLPMSDNAGAEIVLTLEDQTLQTLSSFGFKKTNKMVFGIGTIIIIPISSWSSSYSSLLSALSGVFQRGL